MDMKEMSEWMLATMHPVLAAQAERERIRTIAKLTAALIASGKSSVRLNMANDTLEGVELTVNVAHTIYKAIERKVIE